MKKTLIIGNLLRLGGAEKLIYELVLFCIKNDIEPVILILDNYNLEHYDSIYSEMGVKVIKTSITRIRNFRKPVRLLTSIWWLIKLKFFAEYFYTSVHIMGLYNADKANNIIHKQRLFWHLNNAVQFVDRIYPYQQHIFANERDTIVCINEYQLTEIRQQYGRSAIKSKLLVFKLFINDDSTN